MGQKHTLNLGLFLVPIIMVYRSLQSMLYVLNYIYIWVKQILVHRVHARQPAHLRIYACVMYVHILMWGNKQEEKQYVDMIIQE